MHEAMLDQFRHGDRRALSKLLSLVARGEDIAPSVLSRESAHSPSRVVAVTGGAGVGKSTLVGKLIEHIRGLGLKVAVLACDPQSPVSGGALLGDRLRMPNREDDGVFIRSLAAGAGQGAVAKYLDAMIRLLEAFGFDVILIETVGAGQADTAVRELADVVVLLLQPETGDDLQWEKAGVLEVADVIAVHKADLPGADRVESQVRAALHLSAGPEVPVLRVSSKNGNGIEDLWKVIEAVPLRRARVLVDGAELLRLAQQTLETRFKQAAAGNDPALTQMILDLQLGKLSRTEAGAAVLGLLAAT